MIVVAAIIPTFNRRASLQKVLLCLQRQRLPAGVRQEVIVVVDGSTDGTNEMLASEFPHIHTVPGTGHWWYTHSVNMGLKKALTLEATHFLTLNDDVTFGDDYVELLLSTLQGESRAMAGSASFTESQPCRVTFSGIKKVSGWRLKEVTYLRKFSAVDLSSLRGVLPSENLSGRGMLFTKAAIDELGLLDERFPQYGSDTDYSYRAFRQGFRVLVSYDARIFENELLTSSGAAYNNPKASTYVRSLFNKHSVNSLSKSLVYFRKHGRPALRPLYFLSLLAGAVYVYLFKYKDSRPGK